MGVRLPVDPARLAAGRLVLDGADFRYLARVLRLASGAGLVLFDGAGREAEARVAEVDAAGGLVALDVAEPRPAGRERERLPVTLVLALLKGEKMDLVVQKATELGVERVVPVAAERSVVRLEAGRGTSRAERWRKIAREAARQCGRADVPTVDEVAPLAAALAVGASADLRIVCHEQPGAQPLRELLAGARPAAVAVAIGPEGGFTDGEVEAARAQGWTPCGLGPRVLRAETAALAALAVVGFALGDLG